jgi:hypothetical protein
MVPSSLCTLARQGICSSFPSATVHFQFQQSPGIIPRSLTNSRKRLLSTSWEEQVGMTPTCKLCHASIRALSTQKDWRK